MLEVKYSDDEQRDDRGRWTDGGGSTTAVAEKPPADGYRPLDIESVVAARRAQAAQLFDQGVATGKIARTGADPDAYLATRRNRAMDAAENSARLLAGRRSTWVSSTGNQVDFCTKPKITAARQRDVCESFDRLNRAYPGTNRTVSVTDPKMTRSLGGNGTLGLTRAGGAHIIINAKACQPAGQKAVAESAADGRFSPAAKTANPVDYIVAHEFGHTLDTADTPGGRNPETQRALETLPATSKYGEEGGRAGYYEKYAEAFAEWWCSKGQTSLELPQTLAKTEGWRLPK